MGDRGRMSRSEQLSTVPDCSPGTRHDNWRPVGYVTGPANFRFLADWYEVTLKSMPDARRAWANGWQTWPLFVERERIEGLFKMPATSEAMAQRAWDEVAIINTVSRVAHAQDDADREAYLACFAEKVSLTESVVFPNWTAKELSAEDLVDKYFETMSGYDGAHHIVTNHLVEVAGEEATCIADLFCVCWMVEGGVQKDFTIGGRYALKLRRIAGEWRIWERAIRTRYLLGDVSMPDRAAARVTARKAAKA